RRRRERRRNTRLRDSETAKESNEENGSGREFHIGCRVGKLITEYRLLTCRAIAERRRITDSRPGESQSAHTQPPVPSPAAPSAPDQSPRVCREQAGRDIRGLSSRRGEAFRRAFAWPRVLPWSSRR